MKRYSRVGVVFRKELIETLRDRRTLAAMVLVPIVLYPVLMVIIVEALRVETGRRRAERYSVCVPDHLHEQWLRGVLKREDAGLATQPAASQPTIDVQAANPADAIVARLRSDQVDITVLPADQSLWDVVADHRCHAGVIIEPPPNPEDPADRTNRVVQILRSDTNPRSEFVYQQLNGIFADEAGRIVRSRVAESPEGVGTLTPIITHNLSTSSPQQQFARILAMVVPFLLVIMTVTGALYPAIDLTAGERERGTLETLAVSPVPVGQIVAGKFGVIVAIAMFSTALNLGSMTAMFHFSKLGELATELQPQAELEVTTPDRVIERAESRPASGILTQKDYLNRRKTLESEAATQRGFITTAAPIVLLAMLPFAVLAGGVMLATCSFARTFKEAQNYMMPVMMAFMIPAMIVSYMPTTRLEGVLLVIPVANIVVLIRELFLGNYDVPAMSVCLLSTTFYAAVAITVAARLYGNEAVLFSDVGSYKTLFKRRFFKPQEAPSPAAALLTVAMLFPLYFYWQSYLLDLSDEPGRIRMVIGLGQLLLIALPPLLLAWYLKLDLPNTFSLRAPKAMPTAGALLIAAAVVPVANLLRSIQFHWFPPGEDMLGNQAEAILDGPLWAVLMVLALTPAVCEEVLFRGYLLSGLRQKLSTPILAIIVGLIFGLFHMRIEQIPVHSLIGALLAIVCLRTGSILPGMIVHFANNAIAVAAGTHEGLARFFGVPTTAEELTRLHFDMRDAAFAAIFVLGFILLFVGRAPERADERRSSQL